MRWLAVLVVAGCYGPQALPGSPCDDTRPCPSPLVCMGAVCQVPGGDRDASVMMGDATDSQILIDGCTPMPEICGDGIDQDCNGSDPACPPNDKASGAIDVTAGGNFTATVTYANDDSSRPSSGMFCGGTGGRDVFYKVTLTADETYYFDTFGSDFDTVIRVFHGACTNGIAPNGTKCHNDNCSTSQSQGIFDLTAGDTCIVIDQASSAETKGSLHLRVERGHRTGSPLTLGAAIATAGNTTNSADQQTGTCSTAGPDDGYYFSACPMQSLAVSATTCNATTTWDTSLYLRGPMGQITCNDDDAACANNTTASTISATAAGNHLFYLVVDSGAAGVVGAYELDTTIQ